MGLRHGTWTDLKKMSKKKFAINIFDHFFFGGRWIFGPIDLRAQARDATLTIILFEILYIFYYFINFFIIIYFHNYLIFLKYNFKMCRFGSQGFLFARGIFYDNLECTSAFARTCLVLLHVIWAVFSTNRFFEKQKKNTLNIYNNKPQKN